MSADATLETLGDRSALTEGPVWVPDGPDGYLLFSDNAANVIYKWARNRPLSVFLEKSGYTGTDTSNVGSQTIAGRVAILLIGSNGLALDPQGRGCFWPIATTANASNSSSSRTAPCISPTACGG